MSTTREAFASGAYAPGERSPAVLPLSVPDNRIAVHFDCTDLERVSGAAVEIALEVSQDAGANWSQVVSCIRQGGPAGFVADGVARTRAGVALRWLPGEGNPDRRVRVTLRTFGTVTMDVQVVSDSGGREPSRGTTNSVAYDASGDAQGDGVSSVTISSITVANNPNRLLRAYVGLNSFPASEIAGGVSSVVFNTTETLTEKEYAVHTASPNNFAVGTYYRVAPTATTANIVLTLATGNCDRIHFGWASFYNVKQATPLGTNVKVDNGTGTDWTGSCTGVTDGMADGFAFGGSDTAGTKTIVGGGGSQTDRFEEENINGSGSFCAGSMSTIAGAGALSFTWTFTNGGGGSVVWMSMCCPINPAGLEQEGFRFRDDDDDEADASWLAIQDTDVARNKELNTRLRLLLNADGVDPATTPYKLQYRRQGVDGWRDVPLA